jgi:hypothetical protein
VSMTSDRDYDLGMRPPGIGAVTPTLCDLMGVARPRLSREEPIGAVSKACREAGVSRVERCLVYAPDAIGSSLLEREADMAGKVARVAPVVIPLQSVFPSKTPACFATMFTGAPPEVHGIQEYERPVLECDTLFDTLIRAGKRPAIVSVEDASVDIIFRGRDMDYFSEPYDCEVTERVLELIEADRHDFILAYHQAYDDILHEATPEAREALAAVEYHIDAFVEMVAAARGRWEGRGGLVAFAPDHGAHVDPATGRGTHGSAMPEDMNVLHFFGVT